MPAHKMKNRHFFAFLLAGLITTTSYAEIVFSSKVMGPVANIYSASAEGKITKLTSDESWRDIEGSLSKNGDVVFLSNRKADKQIELHKYSDSFNIFMIEKKSGNTLQLTDNTHHKSFVKFSRDNTLVSYLEKQDNKQSLKLINIEEKSNSSFIRYDNILDYDWSHNGNKITIAATEGDFAYLLIVDVKTKKTTTLFTVDTREPKTQDAKQESDSFGYIFASCQWSPNDKNIAYIQSPLREGTRKLFNYNIEQKNSTLLSKSDVHVQSPINWSKDNTTVIYAALVNYQYLWDDVNHKKVYKGGMNIFTSTLNGATTQLTKGDILTNRPVFSPDEKSIAYLYSDSLASRNLSLKTMNLENKTVKDIYPSVLGGSQLHWY